jgi:hypothetical protein
MSARVDAGRLELVRLAILRELEREGVWLEDGARRDALAWACAHAAVTAVETAT